VVAEGQDVRLKQHAMSFASVEAGPERQRARVICLHLIPKGASLVYGPIAGRFELSQETLNLVLGTLNFEW